VKRQIFIHLGDPVLSGEMPETVQWYVMDEHSRTGPVYHGDLKTASNHAMGCRVTVFVSGVEVVLTDVALPVMNKQKLLKAIPFALEEQLASDVEDNHFAAGERPQPDKITVAIVERTMIDQWLNNLKDVGIQPDVVTTEVLAVPFEEKTWTLLLKSPDKYSKSKAILRNYSQGGIALDVANVVPLLRSMLESLSDENRPEKLNVIVCDELTVGDTSNDTASELPQQDPNEGVAQQAQQEQAAVGEEPASVTGEMALVAADIKKLGESLELEVDVHQVDQSFLIYLANQFEESKAINLLQGDYSRREQLEKLVRPWIPAAAMVAVWLLIQVGLTIADYQKLSAKEQALRAQVTDIYRDTFPEDKNIVDPRVQMEQKLAELRKQSNQSADMFVLLARAGEVLGDTDSLLIRTLRFKEETLDLDFEISDLQALDQLKVRLINEASLEVDIQSASSRRGKVESRMQLKVATNPGNNSEQSQQRGGA
jgi:general secretion pathway protein L